VKKATSTSETSNQLASLQRQLFELQEQMQRNEEDRYIQSISVNIKGRTKQKMKTQKKKKTITTTERKIDVEAINDIDDSSLSMAFSFNGK